MTADKEEASKEKRSRRGPFVVKTDPTRTHPNHDNFMDRRVCRRGGAPWKPDFCGEVSAARVALAAGRLRVLLLKGLLYQIIVVVLVSCHGVYSSSKDRQSL
jgi:hypothetical protein